MVGRLDDIVHCSTKSTRANTTICEYHSRRLLVSHQPLALRSQLCYTKTMTGHKPKDKSIHFHAAVQLANECHQPRFVPIWSVLYGSLQFPAFDLFWRARLEPGMVWWQREILHTLNYREPVQIFQHCRQGLLCEPAFPNSVDTSSRKCMWFLCKARRFSVFLL